MITEDEWQLYVDRVAERDGTIKIWSGAIEWLQWRVLSKAWCPRCETITKWKHEEGKGYERIICKECGLFFVLRDGGIYDVGVDT
jgi:hypothetical protein